MKKYLDAAIPSLLVLSALMAMSVALYYAARVTPHTPSTPTQNTTTPSMPPALSEAWNNGYLHGIKVGYKEALDFALAHAMGQERPSSASVSNLLSGLTNNPYQ